MSRFKYVPEGGRGANMAGMNACHMLLAKLKTVHKEGDLRAWRSLGEEDIAEILAEVRFATESQAKP